LELLEIININHVSRYKCSERGYYFNTYVGDKKKVAPYIGVSDTILNKGLLFTRFA